VLRELAVCFSVSVLAIARRRDETARPATQSH
jgi:hypothetical protein